MSTVKSPEELSRAKEVARQVMEESKREEGLKKIKGARVILIVLTVLMVISGIYEGYGPLHSQLAMIIDLAIAGTFIGCYFLSKQYPFPAFLIALLIYLTIQILLAIVDAQNIARGSLWKIVIIGLLINGMIGARKYHVRKTTSTDELLDDAIID